MAQRQESATGTIGATGAATLQLRPQGRQTWTVVQVSLECSGAVLGSVAELRLNDRLVSPAIAARDVVAGDPAVELRPNADVLAVSWRGCTPGAALAVLWIYDDGRST